MIFYDGQKLQMVQPQKLSITLLQLPLVLETRSPQHTHDPQSITESRAFLHVCSVTIPPSLLFSFSLMKIIIGVAFTLTAAFTETLLLVNLPTWVSHGCSYLKPVGEACKVGVPGQLLPNRNNRRVTPAEHWGCRAGRPRAGETIAGTLYHGEGWALLKPHSSHQKNAFPNKRTLFNSSAIARVYQALGLNPQWPLIFLMTENRPSSSELKNFPKTGNITYCRGQTGMKAA